MLAAWVGIFLASQSCKLCLKSLLFQGHQHIWPRTNCAYLCIYLFIWKIVILGKENTVHRKCFCSFESDWISLPQLGHHSHHKVIFSLCSNRLLWLRCVHGFVYFMWSGWILISWASHCCYVLFLWEYRLSRSCTSSWPDGQTKSLIQS